MAQDRGGRPPPRPGRRSEDIAIIGVGCRLPGGVRGLDALWQALLSGVDAVTEVPASRWSPAFHDPDPQHPGAIYCPRGAFLDDIDTFDADFFGIAPREVHEIDPQQRLALATAWAAMEDAGVPQAQWAGSRTGVYMGILGTDYTLLHAKTIGVAGIDPYYATGKEFSFTAGRIGYLFGLHGPCMTVNSACSSSLVAVHLASQALRAGECDAALAGGVNLLLAPELSVFMSKVRALSPSGRCSPFDAAADGVVRGEGCGVVVLRRLADALADRNRILGVLPGSATNHDGRSAGLTVPNPAAQRRLLCDAMRAADITPGQLSYVEAHATGTRLGDPIELATLAMVIGQHRAAGRPLLIGSHKANFGHLDSAAGVIGLLKALLVVRHRMVPPQIHLTTPSPAVDWARSGLQVATRATSLDDAPAPLLAGVSAFGLSGSNVHVVVAGPPDVRRRRPPGASVAPPVLVLSGPSTASLRTHAADVRDLLSREDRLTPADVRYTAAAHRTHHEHRLAVTGQDSADLIAALDRELAAGSDVIHDNDNDDRRKRAVVHVFAGDGAQWPGMALDLYRDQPTVRAVLDECDALTRQHAGWSLIEELGRTTDSRLADPDYARTAVVGVQVALSRLWRSWGVGPAVVIGHGVGEISAAVAGGVLDLEQGVRLALAPDGPAELPDWLTPGTSVIRVISSVDPDVGPPQPANAFWTRAFWPPTARWPAVDSLLTETDAALVEIGPQPQLSRPLREAMARHGRTGPCVTTLEPGIPARTTLAHALGSLHVSGIPVDWAAVHGGRRTPVDFPPVPLGGDHYWLPGVERGDQGDPPARAAARLSAVSPSAPPVPVPAVRVTAGPVQPPDAKAPAEVLAQTAGREQVAVRIAQIIAELLGHQPGKRLSRVRSFFDLGMNSVTVVEFLGHLQQEFDRELDEATIIDHPSIEQLTGVIMSLGPVRAAPSGQPVPEPGGQPAPEPAARAVPEPARPAAPRAAQPPDNRPEVPEPIAVVGIGLRLPGGARGPDGYWDLLASERDACTEVPADRWDARALLGQRPVQPGQVSTSRGCFLDGIDQFDNAFFRISAHEAQRMDPQQRIFLEVAWEALDDAGVDAGALAGSRTGLFVGLNTTDYQQILTRHAEQVDLYYGTGNCFAGTAGRMSYFLGIRGPSLAVDTACSSSLTAVHLACQSLRSGEATLAIAGGTNAILTPIVYMAMSAAGGLAADGRCKTFSDEADGYGRGEGAGAVILKPLSRAVTDGDRIYAVLLGSSVNHNGASGGLTVPSATAQEEVIRDAVERSGLAPSEVDYVEAHGTGTILGDAVEVQGLRAALGQGRDQDNPLLVGSVKTNIGHLEAAAGVAGLIKTALAVYHGAIPAHRHATQLSRRIPWDRLPLRITTKSEPWPAHGRRRVGGVSAFGFTGTNAHVVVAEGPSAPRRPSTCPGRAAVLPVSGTSWAELSAAAAALRERLRSADPDPLGDLIYTAGRRTHLDYRVAITGRTADEIAGHLAVVADGSLSALPAGTYAGQARADEPARLALVFGTAAAEIPWADLDRSERSFSQALAQCDEAAMAVLGQPVRQSLLTGGASDPVTLLAAQVAMTALWHDYGVHPDTVVGLGSGMVAAAHAAGTVDLASAFGLVAGISHESHGKVPAAHVPDQPPAVGRPTLVPPDGAAVADLATLAGALATDGIEIVLDTCLGPAALALASCRDDLQAMSVAAQGRDAAAKACAQLYAAGVRLDWRQLSGGGQVISLPLHPWQHRSHWIQVPVKADGSPAPAGQDATESARPPSVLAAALRTALADRREEQALDVVLGVVTEVLGETSADISPDRGFFELGMDSVMAIRAKVRLEEAYDIELPDTITFECPNSRELASFVVAEVLRTSVAAAPGTQSQPGSAAAPEPGSDLADHVDELSDADLLDSLDAVLVTSQSLLGDEGRQ